MEDLFILLFLFVVLPFLSRLFSANKRRQQQTESAPDADAYGELHEDDASLEEALRQIREAMGAPQPEPQQRPAPQPARARESTSPGSFHDRMATQQPPAPPKAQPQRPAPSRPEPRRQEPLRQEHRRSSPSRSEPRWTQRQEAARRGDVPEVSAEMLANSPIYERPPGNKIRQAAWQKRGNIPMERRLRNPHTAMDGLIMAEILGLPRASRPWKSGRS